VVVYGLQRSGTTWISSIVDHLAGARCKEEILLETPVLPGSYLAEAPKTFSRWDRVVHPIRSRVAFFDQVLTPTEVFPIVGAKLMFSQTTWPVEFTGRVTRRWPQLNPVLSMRSLRRLLIDNDVAVIVVERKNVLKLRVSEMIAHQTGIMHSTEAARPVDGVHLDPSTLVNRLERTQRRQAAARRFVRGCRTVDIFYEDSEAQKRDALCRALGLDEIGALESRYQKVTTDDLRISITNYDEVAARLRGTRFEWCLGETS
jgi:LPS sulfotransferase NodH